ncbi:MAG: ribonuclease J [Acidobacteria bacterium]|nr:MAG: ribonuclease J [Acidobacteriota bacterium]REK01381.1 MAG: ribonuclease J [Acidobacteriota bacterium]REK14337.1 MAG: ribonuclease J [Acidobacteriota bacterium]REK45052.1 MAG: ribonuclease J [Acidobacteriota bacterium]
MNKLEIIPLGGIGEFGMNTMAVRFDDEMIVIDAGMGFPEESSYGVDIAIPDFELLEPYRAEITALFLTHGHEDHIGAVPYFLKRFNVPVYASRFTLGFIERKLEEHGILGDVLMHTVEARDVVEVGSFDVEFINASHSLIDCFSLAVTTPVGTIVHTGDYKIDDTPVIGDPYDLEALRKIGDEGVLALFSDSTNATVPGRTPSESEVVPELEKIFDDSEGRLIVTTFSSSLHRIQIILDLAEAFGRRVCVLGRSMMANVELAEEMGFLEVPEGVLVGLADSRALEDDQLVYLVTGSQGEPRAVMWNLATQSYKGLSIRQGDTVVLSARIIPGNEKRISKMIGAIYRKGGNIIEEKRRLIHVSGHGSQEDIRIITETARPKFVIPIHGEFRMLFRHKEFLKNHLGYRDDRVVIVEDGDVLELTPDSARIIDQIEPSRVFIEDDGFREIAQQTLKERKKLAFNGVVNLTVTIDQSSGKMLADPVFSVRGVGGVNGTNGFSADAVEIVRKAVNEIGVKGLADIPSAEEHLRLALKRYIKKTAGSKPLIIPRIVRASGSRAE